MFGTPDILLENIRKQTWGFLESARGCAHIPKVHGVFGCQNLKQFSYLLHLIISNPIGASMAMSNVLMNFVLAPNQLEPKKVIICRP